MFGITPVPIYDPQQTIRHLQSSMVFFRAGDIVRFKAIDREEYDQTLEAVENGQYTLRTRPFTFDLVAYQADPDDYKTQVTEALYVD